ncbi:MAG: hypothetical protein OXG85_05950 [Chloroflexi bacterium]|nr:hypothetical protein [Chloroflexota bacterium]
MLKNCAILIAFIILLLPASGALADTTDEAMLCGDLSAADCDIRLSHQAAMDALYSLAFSLSANISVEAEAPSESLSLSMNGAGRLAFDRELMSQLEAMEAQAALNATAMAGLIETALSGLTGEISLMIAIDAEGELEEFPLDLLLKDGVIALDFTALSGESAGSEMSMGSLGISFAGLAEALESEGAIPESLQASPADISESALAQSMTITRLPDSEVNGVSTAVFQTALDADALTAIFDMTGLAKAEAAANAPSATLHVFEYVGLADFLTHRVELAMTDLPNPEPDALGAVNISLDMRIDFGGYNEPVEVSLPEDMMIMPLSMMMEMGQ